MTYVVGIKNGDVCALICDSMVTFGNNKGESLNYSLKSGSLFPGCCYAAVGYADPMRKFVEKCKIHLSGRDTINSFWNKFEKYCAIYQEFDAKQPFQLLLMSRHSGESKFYLFSSSDASIEEQGDFVTLGSGKKILDPYLINLYEKRNAEIIEYLNDNKAPKYYFAYFYCLGLMEMVQGDVYEKLNSVGVGGVFHFSYQTFEKEHRQDPAVYVIILPFLGMKRITYTVYRVTFEEMSLVIEDGAAQSFNISIDSAVWPKIKQLNDLERSSLNERLRKAAVEQPFYNFCGIGFADQKYKNNWINHINYGNDDYLLDRNAIKSDMVLSIVEGIVTGELQKEIQAKLP